MVVRMVVCLGMYRLHMINASVYPGFTLVQVLFCLWFGAAGLEVCIAFGNHL